MQENIIDKIHSKGYWRILIRPIEYEQEKILSLKECREIMDSSVLQLRGWDYPHIDRNNFINGQNFISNSCDFGGHLEYWRLYQSGQFIHHFAMIEDWQSEKISLLGHKYTDLGFKGLEIISTIYKITEIFEFAARMAAKGVFNGNLTINIQLLDTQERKLFFWDNARTLFQEYICNIPKIEFEKNISEQDLIGNGREIALQLAGNIFERYNWNSPIDSFRNEQNNLLQGR